MSTAILTGPPVPGSSLEGDLRSLGFDVRVASGAQDTAALVAAVPGTDRVAVVDPRFVGHVHALRLALTDPRFPAAAVPGALTVQPQARTALARALSAAAGAGTPSGLSGSAPSGAAEAASAAGAVDADDSDSLSAVRAAVR
ncbi:MAG TPA: CDP-alcohol phosphatidyltransferase family protein, partial [Streptomyces sp.]|nr:CDP-alcohol phosphatidyltransferase family protein [Streptomyces sp.]